MARRIDIQLTSKRDDDTWTWRAAGAREPKGTVDGSLLPPESKVGDNMKVEVEGFLDGLTIVAVIPPKASRSEPERIELVTPRTEGSLVTTHLARKPRREDDRRGGGAAGGGRRRDERGGERGGDRDRRGPRSDRGDRERTGAGGTSGGDRDRDRGDRRRNERPTTPPPDAKPKPKRLRPARTHRAALLEALPAEQRPIAEQLLQGGIPAVRQAIEKQNETLKAEGKTQVSPQPLLEVAEKLRNKAQAAVWRDRADAALASVDDLDLRDLRSVVNAADDAGRNEEARAVADQLREALANRVEKEQAAWVAEVAENLQEGRVVRALRLSSRPPKAGSPLPGNLAEQLIAVTNAALTAETGPQRWATVLDALAFSPIRRRVVPDSLPEKLPADLRELIAKLGSRLPEIAHIFAIEPNDSPSRPRPPRRKPGGKPEGAGGKGPRQRKPQDAKAKADGPKSDKPEGDKPQGDAKADEPASDAPEATTDAPPSVDEATTDEATPAPEAEATEATTDEATPAPEIEADTPAVAGEPEAPAETESASEAPAEAADTGVESPADVEAKVEDEAPEGPAAAVAEPEAPAEAGSASEAPVDEVEAPAEQADEAQADAPEAPADADEPAKDEATASA